MTHHAHCEWHIGRRCTCPRGDMTDTNSEGEWRECPHCEGTGKQEGPGGHEPCCHCHGKGERYFEFPDDADRDDLDARTGMTQEERDNLG